MTFNTTDSLLTRDSNTDSTSITDHSTLACDSQGRPVVNRTGSERYYPNGLLHAAEGNASKLPGDLTDRPALCALYDVVDGDPVGLN